MQDASRGEAIVDEEAIDEELIVPERQDQVEKEEVEVEQTRRKLAGLDAQSLSGRNARSSGQKEDPAVTSDTTALRRLSLVGASPPAGERFKGTNNDSKEHIAENAS